MRNEIGAVLLLATWALPAAGAGEARPVAGMTATERTALVEAAPKGAPFKSGKQTYRIVGGLRAAVPRGDGDALARLAAVGATASDLVEAKGSYLVFRSHAVAAGAPVSAATAAEPAPTLPVAVNTRTGRLGVVANVIIVRLPDVSAAAALAAANGLKVDFVAERIGYAFLSVPDGRDIVGVAASLAKDARVQSAEVEVRENFRIPM